MTTADESLLYVARQRGLPLSGDTVDAKLARSVAAEFGMPWVDLDDHSIDSGLITTMPGTFLQENGVLPLVRQHGLLQVAVADPLAIDIIDQLALVAGEPVQPVLAADSAIRAILTRIDREESNSLENFISREYSDQNDASDPDPSVTAEASDGPIIRLVQVLLAEAIRRRASDIHLEPLGRRFRVRHRIDGILHEASAPDLRLHLPVISRLKIMANLSIAEKRLPQDGRLRITVDGRALDLRVSSLPTVHGESLVLRILDQTSLQLGLPELGFQPADETEFTRQITSPDGLMLVTGPTGSGKTTTLYACLHHLNQADRKIITVEDPVEYQVKGINQVPVNAAIGMTFAAALRAMLRQAPNVVMVGEIRDRETAGITLNAALTGHMVFSTLHTNDAPSAIPRLIDLGAQPYLVAAALRSVVAQRLVRRICPSCKKSHAPSVGELHAIGLEANRLVGAEFAHGVGCAECQGTGYRGRLGIFEILLVHDGIRAMIYDDVTASRLRKQVRQDGMCTMRDDGIRKILAGLTTIEEIVSVTNCDQP